jgi:hypothetical protein
MKRQDEFNKAYCEYQKTKAESLRLNDFARAEFDRVNEKIETLLVPELIIDNKITEPIGISFEEASVYKLGEITEVADGVYFKTVIKTDTHIRFISYLMDGTGYYFHFHKNCFELTKVIKGMLFERTKSQYATVLEGESIMYAEGEVHSPYASKDSIWEVNLYKSETLE